MSGEVQLKTVADYQAAISKLDRNKPADRAKIEEYCKKISEFFAKNEQTTSTETMDVKTEMGLQVNVNAKIAQKPQIAAQEQYTDKEKIKNEFSKGALPETEWKQLEQNYETAKYQFKELDKQLKKSKPGDEDFTRKISDFNHVSQKLNKLQQQYDEEKIRQDIKTGKGAGGIQKAAKNNVKNFTNVYEREQVFTSKEEEELYLEKNPDKKGTTAHLSEKQRVAVAKISSYAQFQIDEAQKSGSAEALKAAQERWGDYADICPIVYDTDKDGNKVPKKDKNGYVIRDWNNPDTRKTQNALVDESGFDQRFNDDELKKMEKMYHIKKGDIKGTVKKYGFGTENLNGKKLKNAAIATAAAGLGNLLMNRSVHKKAEASATAEGETVQGEVKWLATNGEKFYKYFEAKGGTAAVSVVAEAVAKIPGLNLVAGPALAGITTYFLSNSQSEDAFNGARAEEVLNNINLVEGKDNKPIVLAIKDMQITGNEGVDKKIKAAVLEAAINGKANTEELLASYENLKTFAKEIGKVEVTPKEEAKPPVEKKPNLDIEHEEKHEEVRVRTELPRMKYREGTWYTSHGYVGDDGKNLTPAEMKQVQAELKKAENMIAYVDTNGDGVANAKDKKVSLPNELTLPSGKKVKLADDAYERIMKLPATGGGKGGNYGKNVVVVMDKTTHKYYVIDKDNGNKRIAGPYADKQDAINKKTELEKPKEEK